MEIGKVNDDVFNRFMRMVVLYVNTAFKALDILKDHLKVDNPMYWRQSDIPRSGLLNNSSEYRFHGVCCELKNDDYEIDFEFGFDGRVGGVSSWRLSRLLRVDRKNLKNFVMIN